MKIRKTILGLSVVAAAAASAVACTDSTPANPGGNDAATTDDSATGSSGSSSGSSGGSSGSSSGSSSGGSSGSSSGSSSGGSDAGSLYTALGGHAGIRAAVDAVVAAELADPTIKTYFFNQVAGTAGHPTALQIEECFTDLIAANVGGSEKYPTTVGPFDDAGVSIGDGGVTDGGGTWTCRDMATIHKPVLHISGPTFDYFVSIAAGVLQAPPFKLSGAPLTTLAGLLTGTKPDIVDPSQPDAGDAGPFK